MAHRRLVHTQLAWRQTSTFKTCLRPQSRHGARLQAQALVADAQALRAPHPATSDPALLQDTSGLSQSLPEATEAQRSIAAGTGRSSWGAGTVSATTCHMWSCLCALDAGQHEQVRGLPEAPYVPRVAGTALGSRGAGAVSATSPHMWSCRDCSTGQTSAFDACLRRLRRRGAWLQAPASAAGAQALLAPRPVACGPA